MMMKTMLAAAGLTLALPLWAGDGRSLYQEDTFQALTADHRAHKPGDLLTVVVSEDTSASSSADTTTGRDADVGVGLKLPLPAGSQFRGSHSAHATTNSDFTGQGQTARTGRVFTQITVPVTAALPNGDLVIGGAQELEINGERQKIRIEGRVRQVDISQANTVASTRVAEARLSIAGDGTLNDQQKPGWWQRLLTLFGV